MSFGADARRLMGVAAVLLGWRPADFWAATPGELAVILHAMTESADGVAGAGAAGMDADELARLKEICPDDG
ncbi:MAG TPA: phage tail assembly chaperone [Sphingobium sp.]